MHEAPQGDSWRKPALTKADTMEHPDVGFDINVPQPLLLVWHK
jgi:hypothetical protein